MEKPRIKPFYHVEVVEPDTVFLLTETAYQILTGRVYKNLIPLLDGHHTMVDLIMALDGKVFPPEIFAALNQLGKQGYLDGGYSGQEPAVDAYWQTLNVPVPNVYQQLTTKRVHIQTIGACDPAPLQAALETVGIGVTDDAQADLLVVVTDDYLREPLEAINQTQINLGQPWVVLKLIGTISWLGPFFSPPDSACWACLKERIQSNRQIESYILNKKQETTPLPTSRGFTASTLQTTALLAATEIAKWVALGKTTTLHNQLITLNHLDGAISKHMVVRRPQCAACSQSSKPAPQPVILSSSPKRFMNDGGHRAFFPEETFARYQHHISPITGIVNALVDMTGEINGITYSYAASHNFAMVSDDINVLKQNIRGRSGGKGQTNIQAKVSAIGEAIERYSGVFRNEREVLVRQSYEKLAETAVHPYDCLLFSPTQYENRYQWNQQRTTNFHLVPNPFDPSLVIDWTPLWSLTEEKFKYLPSAYCYYGHPDLRYFFTAADANGCAAGNTVEEAVLQGFLELVERDAVAIWWYNRLKHPRLDVTSFNLPYFDTLQAFYQQHNREIWVLDITTDLKIPAFAAISRRVDQPVEDIIIGFGAHLDPHIALLRALTELNQLYSNVRFTNPDGSTRYLINDQDTMDWFTKATVANQPYLLPHETVAARKKSDYPYTPPTDLLVDVTTCVQIAQKAGLEVLVLDQTLPDVQMPVCRVVVPGLRHFWRRLGNGRLYDVPVKMGWLDKPIPESGLNPISFFF